MELSIAIIYVSLGIYMMIYSYDKWKSISSDLSINDDLVKKRKYYRNIAVWGLLFVIGAFRYYMHGILWDLRLLPETTSMLIIGIFLGYFRCFIEPYYNSSIVGKLTDFCLYLRPFDIDKRITSKLSPYLWGGTANVENRICSIFSRRIAQTFAIGNPNSNIPTTLFTSNIYANDEEWKNVIKELAHKSKAIILHVGTSDGCIWEMGHCVENDYLNKTLFLVENQEMFDLLRKRCGVKVELKEQTISSSHIIYFDDASNCWIVNSIKSKKDINNVINKFIISHNLQEESNSSDHQDKTIPARWWQILAFSTNAFAYFIYQRWPLRMWKYIIVYFVLLYICAVSVAAFLFSIYSMAEVLIINFAIIGILLLPWWWIAPKISYKYQKEGGDYIFAQNNRLFALWLCAFFICNTIIFVTPWLLQALFG
jgi:hypothetical protein